MPKTKDFKKLSTNKCEGFKECMGRSPDLDLEDCRECVDEALGEVFKIFVNDPEDIK